MIKTMQIDYVREVLENQFAKNENDLFTDNDIKLFSFYEHLTDQEEVNRYVETYNDLINQQNKHQWVGFGVLTTEGNPTITNIKNSFISDFSWSISIRCSLANRDKMIATIYDLIAKLKGKKQDVAELESGKLLCVGTIGNHEIKNKIYDFDFVGSIENLQNLHDNYGFDIESVNYVYCEVDNHLRLYENIGNGQWMLDNEFDEVNYKKMKVDLSFDEIKVAQPYNINVSEYCTITFGGSATLCDYNIKVGNDLIALYIRKDKVKAEIPHIFNEDSWTYLEPISMPSGISANGVPSLLRSNYFKQNSHNDSVANSIQYDFVVDESIELINEWFEYARYGINNLTEQGTIQQNSITPNIIYQVKEQWCSWGVIKEYIFYTKIVEDIDIEESENDALTMSLTMQLQGEND